MYDNVFESTCSSYFGIKIRDVEEGIHHIIPVYLFCDFRPC